MKPKITLIMPVYNQEVLVVKALDSMPIAKDIQYIIIDDGSTDDSWKRIIEWHSKNRENIHKSSLILRKENGGIASVMNMGFTLAEGEYIVSLSSDDYYVTDFEKFRPYLDGQNDMVYFDLEINDGTIWEVNEETKAYMVGAVKFMRREFLGDTRVPDMKYCEDKPFSEQLYAKNPKEVFTGIVLKHYNYPREGSLSWQYRQDLKDDKAEM